MQELALGHYFESQAQNMASIDCIGIGIMDFERCDGATRAVKVLLCVGFLLFGLAEDFGMGGGLSRRETFAGF